MKVNRTSKRTIEMLELISKNPKGLSLNEIVNMMDIPKTSAFDILHTLEELEMVELIDARSKLYSIGVRSFIIGNAYIDNADLVNIAKPYLEKLGEQAGKTVFLGKESKGKVIYLYKYEPERAIITTCKIGNQNELHCTGLGKCALAFSEDYKEIIDKLELRKRTEFTIVDKDKLTENVEQIKKQKFSVDFREYEEHMLCLAAPLFDHKGEFHAAISISGLYVEGMDFKEEVQMLQKTAETISRKLGFSGHY
ncbi:IclR family transcriptional regulator [Clostridium grantii]|uniref:Transcriptional regulator, IclR family n=1 Tax=Clostridium grantii DSM 8605 TaxID=1121316 RepID=A0A1M5UW05_9CLOT|nr:IclR family transcriptional regulator [Clostridium grantii]SHH67171.1 transcriptional regulator, IclR family [Clostridium grantii DSM 8605]